MTQMRIYATQASEMTAGRASAAQPLFSTSNPALISAELKTRGIKFQRWPSQPGLEQGASQEQILLAYQSLIRSVQKSDGYGTVDVMRVGGDQPSSEPSRQTFLREHQHAEDEVRFFVEGRGLFSLHTSGEVASADLRSQ